MFVYWFAVYLDIAECKYHRIFAIVEMRIVHYGNINVYAVPHNNVEIYGVGSVFWCNNLVAFEAIKTVWRKQNAFVIFQQRYFALQRKYVSCETREVWEAAFRLFYNGRRYAQVETTGRQVAIGRTNENLSGGSTPSIG